MPEMFLSYPSSAESLVARVAHNLRRQTNVTIYFHPEQRKAGRFGERLKEAIDRADYFVAFIDENSFAPAKGRKRSWQNWEIERWLNRDKTHKDRMVCVVLDQTALPEISGVDLNSLENILDKKRDEIDEFDLLFYCAENIIELFELSNSSFDDLPAYPLESSEKDLIDKYQEAGDSGMSPKDLALGYPNEWPEVPKINLANDGWIVFANPLDEKQHGKHRQRDASIVVDARIRRRPAGRHGSSMAATGLAEDNPANLSGLEENQQRFEGFADSITGLQALTFPEAGPRQEIVGRPKGLRVGLLVSGGIAPGINAVLSAIIERHKSYEQAVSQWISKNRMDGWQSTVTFIAFPDGFKSLCRGNTSFELTPQGIDQIERWAHRAGSWLPTARADDFLDQDHVKREKAYDEAVRRLNDSDIDILYVIGGEGSMRGAHALQTIFNRQYPDRSLRIVCVPKTMDNDILFMWQSFGFETAVGEAERETLHLAAEVSSNPRLGIMQLFGSNSGFVASHTAAANSVCDLVLIPELVDASMDDICKRMRKKLQERLAKANNAAEQTNVRAPYGLVIMAETFLPKDYLDHIDDTSLGLTDEEKTAIKNYGEGRASLIGQTPDELRTGVLKLVSGVLRRFVNEEMGMQDGYWRNFRIITNEPRHLVRSADPAPMDGILAARLGTMAVDSAMAGYTDCMVSSWLTEYVIVPLKLVVLGRKRVQRDGVFWKTVVARTQQNSFSNLM